MPLDEFARRILTARGGAVGRSRPASTSPISKDTNDTVERATQVFCGVRMLCARCHTHPLENWTQADYYGLASFFNQVSARPGRRGSRRAERQAGAGQPGGRHRRPIRARASRSRRSFLGGDEPKLAAGDRPPRGLRPLAHRAGEPVLRPRPGQPRLELLLPSRHHRAGGRHPQHQPADQPGPARRADEGLRRPQVRRPAPDAADRHLGDLSAHERAERRRTATTSRTSRTRFRAACRPRRCSIRWCRRPACRENFGGAPGGFRAAQLPDANVESAFLSLFGKPQRMEACECERDNGSNMLQALHFINGKSILGRVQNPAGRVRRSSSTRS